MDDFVEFLDRKSKEKTDYDNIADIIQSKEWIDFYILLREEPDKAPPVCHHKCDSNSSRGDVYDVNK